MYPVQQSAREWADEARKSLAAARTLAAGRHWRHAYMTSGHAVELALKARIMHNERLNRWPSRSERRELYDHSLDRLMRIAGLQDALGHEVLALSPIGLAWMAMKDFDINRRYPDGRAFPVKLGRDGVEAVGGLGLVEWLITDIR